MPARAPEAALDETPPYEFCLLLCRAFHRLNPHEMKTRFTLLLLSLLLANICHSQFNWEHTGGPNGGSLSRIYSNSEYAFYADKYYFYRTADGMTWEQLPEAGIGPLATNGSNLAAKSLSNHFPAPGSVKFIISHDNGTTWTEANMPPGSEYFSEIVWCSHGIYIPKGQEGFIYRSTDEGQTWDTIFPPFQYGYYLWKFDDRLYSVSSSNLWRTDANGENWASIPVPLDTNEYIKTIFASDQNLLVSTQKKIWHSHDDGQTWSNQGKPWDENFESFQLVGDTLYVAGSGNLARSADFGITWEGLILDNNYHFYLEYLATAGGHLLGSTYSKGVLRWDDASGSLVDANDGLASAAIISLKAGGSKLWASAGTGLYEYDPIQETWSTDSPLPIPELYYAYLSANDEGYICTAEWFSDHFFLSTDFGQSWDTIYPESDFWGKLYIDRLYLFQNVIIILDDFFYYVWRSEDLGASWQLVADYNSDFWDIVNFNGKLLANSLDKIFVSSDFGKTWEELTEFPYGYIYRLLAMDERLFASVGISINGQYHRRLYTSTDGINWTYAHDGLPEIEFYVDPTLDYLTPVFYNHQGTPILSAPSFGYFTSLDSCKTWLPVGPSLGSTVTFFDGKVYSGGYGGGVFQSEIPDSTYGELAQGIVYFDLNNNGVYDAGEYPFPNVRVSVVQPGGWYPFYFTTTAQDGTWSLGITPNMQDTLRPLIQSAYLESINPPWYVANAGGSGKDFGIYLTPDITDLSVAGQYVFRPRPGYDLRLYAHYENVGTTEPHAKVALRLDPNLTYISAYPTPTAVIGDSLIWDTGQLSLFSGGNISVKTNVPPTTPLGTPVTCTWRVSSPTADYTPDDNVFVLTDTVVGSYDPNEKRVQPAAGLTEAEIAEGKELLYTIQFQNTGNYPAERVRITDMIDTALYLPSLRFVAASHPVSSFELRPGRLLEIVFDNIQLPDSTSNEPDSHGFVTFAIQRNKAFNADIPVRNMAAIYFDFNEPIFTNEVSFTINDTPLAVTEDSREAPASLLIFPNPAGEAFTVSSRGHLSGPGRLILRNVAGRIVAEQFVTDLATPQVVSSVSLPAGIYFVQLSGDGGQMAGKVAVMAEKQ